MSERTEPDAPRGVNWKISLAAEPEAVFRLVATDAGRAAFWAEESRTEGERFHLTFANGAHVDCRVIRLEPPHLISFEYFGGSRVDLRLAAIADGGTDFEVSEAAPPAWEDHYPGWVAWLYCLKGAADFGITLKSRNPSKTWQKGYVDG